jgi:hypothetical protein
MRCVFPNAIKPWQKVACATVGVAGLIGGVCAGVYAFDMADKKIIDTRDGPNGHQLDPRLFNGAIVTFAGIFGCWSLAG